MPVPISPSSEASPAAGGTQAIGRAMSVLAELVDGEMGVSELAARLDLRVPTTHRIVRGLVDSGFVTQNEQTDRYRLGWAAILFGRAAGAQHGLDLVDVALRGLATELGATASFNVRGPACGLVLAAVTSDGSAPDSAPGATASFHASAAGKALLAWGPDPLPDAVDALGDLETFTDRTIVTRDDLLAELDAVRQRGHSVDDRESAERCQGFAVPVLDEHSVARAAIAVVGPRGLTARQRDRAPRVIRPVAVELAEALALDHF
jgi:IclR family acetate operon transcriptional repressor